TRYRLTHIGFRSTDSNNRKGILIGIRIVGQHTRGLDVQRSVSIGIIRIRDRYRGLIGVCIEDRLRGIYRHERRDGVVTSVGYLIRPPAGGPQVVVRLLVAGYRSQVLREANEFRVSLYQILKERGQ